MKAKVDIDDIQVFWSYAEPATPAIVVIKGELGLNIAYRLRTVLFELIDLMEPERDLYVDLRHVDYISSSGVGILSAAMVHAGERQIHFYVSSMMPKVRVVFDSLGLTSWFTEKNPIAQEP